MRFHPDDDMKKKKKKQEKHLDNKKKVSPQIVFPSSLLIHSLVHKSFVFAWFLLELLSRESISCLNSKWGNVGINLHSTSNWHCQNEEEFYQKIPRVLLRMTWSLFIICILSHVPTVVCVSHSAEASKHPVINHFQLKVHNNVWVAWLCDAAFFRVLAPRVRWTSMGCHKIYFRLCI